MGSETLTSAQAGSTPTGADWRTYVFIISKLCSESDIMQEDSHTLF